MRPCAEMKVVTVSAALALAGVVVSRWWVGRLAAGERAPEGHVPWLLGLVALVPAWLVAFTALLGTVPGVPPHAGTFVPWVLSAAAGLVGAIASEARVRHAGEAPPAWCWWAGLAGFVPAWALAVAGHALQALIG
jgi:hypothetical protein